MFDFRQTQNDFLYQHGGSIMQWICCGEFVIIQDRIQFKMMV